MWMTALLFPLVLLIWGTMVYLIVLLIRALRKYLKSSDVRAEKAAVKKSLGEAIRTQRTRCHGRGKPLTKRFPYSI